MPEITPKLKLKKPYGNEAVNRVAYSENLELMDTNAASQNDFDNHKNGVVLDHPDNSVTDAKIGGRIITDTTVPVGNTGLLTPLFSGLAYMVRMITGKSDWRTAPALNLEDVRVKLVEAVPPGAIMYFAQSNPPAGWLKANGAAISRSAYSNLFSAIGTTFGAGDGSTTFNLPDLRGEFIRGWDNGRGIDPGRGLGNLQNDGFRYHEHPLKTQTSGVGNDIVFNDYGIWNRAIPNELAIDPNGLIDRAVTFGVGGPETRPRNIALLPCIKY